MAADINAVNKNLAYGVDAAKFKINPAVEVRDCSFINASASVIFIGAALAVNGIPGMRKVNLLRNAVFDEIPTIVNVDYFSHF
jgi:hypothetical protein